MEHSRAKQAAVRETLALTVDVFVVQCRDMARCGFNTFQGWACSKRRVE